MLNDGVHREIENTCQFPTNGNIENDYLKNTKI